MAEKEAVRAQWHYLADDGTTMGPFTLDAPHADGYQITYTQGGELCRHYEVYGHDPVGRVILLRRLPGSEP